MSAFLRWVATSDLPGGNDSAQRCRALAIRAAVGLFPEVSAQEALEIAEWIVTGRLHPAVTNGGAS